MSKLIVFADEARLKIKDGVDKLANAVACTLGPKGRNVVLERSFGTNTITKDGVTVAKEIKLSDHLENIGAQMVKDVASRTNDVAGDGTTTATVLAQAIYAHGLRNVTAGANPMDLKRGIDLAVETVIAEITNMSMELRTEEQIAQVACISANNDEAIGKIIAETMSKVGRDGVVTVEEGKTSETTYEVVDGMQFDRGYISPYFITNTENGSCILENARVLVCDKHITNVSEIIPIFEKLNKMGAQSILLIADDMQAEALAVLVVNKLNGLLKVVAVKSPAYGEVRKEMMHDIAILTGATVISPEAGIKLEDSQPTVAGSAGRIIVTKDTTTIIDGKGDLEQIANRVSIIKQQIMTTDSDYDKEKMQERLAKLSGGVGVIKIGASTELEMKEKKMRIEDALNATKAAVQEGIVPGGGVAYIRALKVLENLKTDNEDINTGINIIRKSLEEPLRKIVSNCGLDSSIVVEKVKACEGYFGFNALTEVYEDLLKAGVIDPTKVARTALENAASVAGLLLTTEAVVYENAEDAKDNQQQAPQY